MPDFANSPAPFIAELSRDRVQIPKAAQIVASRIRRRIIDGELRSGERLATEAELAGNFGVSRPVVREALRILETESFIELGRGARKGARIGKRAPDIIRAMGIALRMRGATLSDIFDARAHLEPTAARFAALHRPNEASAALRRHITYQLTLIDDDQPKFVRSYGEFNRILLRECGNTTLSVTGLALQNVVETHLDLIREQMPQPTHTHKVRLWCVHSHERLADLIAGQDGAGAEAHWRDHMSATGNYWVRQESRLSILQILD